ncbi:unnamed protein product, partial [Owenia fusiformis]
HMLSSLTRVFSAGITQGIARLMSSEPVAKKLCTMKKIGTHNGTFHCDEVLACFLLKQLPEYTDAEIIRTRDPGTLDTCDIVVDVGGVFDPEKHRYDHHQRTFSENMHSLRPEKKWVTKLSSAGLVYLHFGERIIAKLIAKTVDDDITKTIYDKVYEQFVEEIDAVDNGVSQTDGESRYHITTTLSSRVANLNPAWNENNVNVQAQFEKAMQLVGGEFKDRVNYFTNSWWPARTLVVEAFSKRQEVDPSGEILLLGEGGCPWKDHLFLIEAEQNITPSIKYVLFTDQNGKWRVQCAPAALGSFKSRLPLPEEWCGLRDNELSEKSGIPGGIFVHANGFIGGNETFDGALAMARKSLNMRT